MRWCAVTTRKYAHTCIYMSLPKVFHSFYIKEQFTNDYSCVFKKNPCVCVCDKVRQL